MVTDVILSSCQEIINSVRSSSLNFNIQETPYSIYFTVRKTISKAANLHHVPLLKHPLNISDQSEDILIENDSLLRKLDNLKNSNTTLQENYEKTLADCVHLEDLNENLEKDLSNFRDKLQFLESDKVGLVNYNTKLKDDNNFLVSRVEASEASLEEVRSNDELESAVAELELSKNETERILKEKGILEEEILYLKLSDKNQKGINIRLNTEMNRFRARVLKEKVEALKSLKKEIKLWKKKLGNERRKRINLERKLSKAESYNSLQPSSTNSAKVLKSSFSHVIEKKPEEPADEETCSICIEIIPNYTPKFFQGLLINPACSNCDDSKEDSIDDEEGLENNNDKNYKPG